MATLQEWFNNFIFLISFVSLVSLTLAYAYIFISNYIQRTKADKELATRARERSEKALLMDDEEDPVKPPSLAEKHYKDLCGLI